MKEDSLGKGDLIDDLFGEKGRSVGEILASFPPSNKLPRHKPGEQFFRGPIPLDWILLAGSLPAKALLVGMLIWHKGWLCGGKATITFNLHRLPKPFTRRVAQHAIQMLELARLISVQRKAG